MTTGSSESNFYCIFYIVDIKPTSTLLWTTWNYHCGLSVNDGSPFDIYRHFIASKCLSLKSTWCTIIRTVKRVDSLYWQVVQLNAQLWIQCIWKKGSKQSKNSCLSHNWLVIFEFLCVDLSLIPRRAFFLVFLKSQSRKTSTDFEGFLVKMFTGRTDLSWKC